MIEITTRENLNNNFLSSPTLSCSGIHESSNTVDTSNVKMNIESSTDYEATFVEGDYENFSLYPNEEGNCMSRLCKHIWICIFGIRPEFKQRTVYLDGVTHPTHFVDNSIRNTKYNIFTFFPVVLYEQFRFFFNLFYLTVALAQFITPLKIGPLFTYLAPLSFVLTVTIFKEFYDDYLRYIRDKELNNQIYKKVTSQGLIDITAAKIRVGEAIFVDAYQRVPADLIFLRSNDRDNSTFIKTDQLDGETDWKLRRPVNATQNLKDSRDICYMNACCLVEAPRKDIYEFEGKFLVRQLAKDTHPNSSEDVQYSSESLSLENTLWTNTVISSGGVYGLTIYTGKETRAAMNASNAKTKIGLFDLEVNFLSKVLFFFLVSLSFGLSALKGGIQGIWWLYFFRFILLLSSIIPISLRVNLDMAKTLYSVQIMRDRKIPQTIVRTSTIPEELGRIDYLLSDKTGTLTKNEMFFKKIHVGRALFTHDDISQIKFCVENYFNDFRNLNDGKRSLKYKEKHSSANSDFYENTNPYVDLSAPHPNFLPSPDKASKRSEIYTSLGRAIEAISLCHNVTPVITYDNTKKSKITYEAASPDEIALVRFASSIGVELIHRSEQSIKIQTKFSCLRTKEKRKNECGFFVKKGVRDLAVQKQEGVGDKKAKAAHSKERAEQQSVADEREIYTYDILFCFPFTSETKRMGIILKESNTQNIYFYAKGAESVMKEKIQPKGSQWLQEECDNFARQGLRTLVIAFKKLSMNDFILFSNRYIAASKSMNNRNLRCRREIDKLEVDMKVLALTGVEDKLQNDVLSTLEFLRHGRVKIWMLTGDKIETATCIAISAGLKTRQQNFCILCSLNVLNEIECRNVLESFAMGPTEMVLVLDGIVLAMCLNFFPQYFIQVASQAPAVVCCRCSPTQKAEIVYFIKKYTRGRTCAIGDGGNDVSMIQAADVGIGIVGKEGKQASLAADFSIQQFSYLKRLLLLHGRNSYQRSAKLAQFVIHRGLIIAIIQVVFSAVFFFIPLAVFQGWLQVGYATYYTMAPVFSLVLDEELPESVIFMFPELYHNLRNGRVMSTKTFFCWVWKSIYQGTVVMMGAIVLFENSFTNIVAIAFTSLILAELLNAASEIQTWHPLMIASQISTIIIYIFSMFILRSYFDITFIMTSTFWWKVSAITLSSWLPIQIIKVVQKVLQPPQYSKLTVL